MSDSILSSESPIDVELRDHQWVVWNEARRFNVLLAHRRFGKTVLAVAMLVRKALECKQRRPIVHYFCPTYAQAKKVAWQYVKDCTAVFNGTIYNESELKCTLPGGAVIQLGSADNPHASRGIYSDFCVLDEPAQMPPSMWTEVLRPALSDRRGGALFIGTPHGRHGLFYDVWQQAEDDDQWWRGIFRAQDTHIVDDGELQSAQRSMSVAEYDQEFNCSWDAAIKGAYWAESMQVLDEKGRITSLVARPDYPVHISMDLGINDATACWFFQCDGELIRFIDYAEYTNMGLPDIVNDWKGRQHVYGKVIAPHDIKVRSLSTGMTRLDTLYSLGLDVIVAPSEPVITGVEAVRSMLPRCSFDKDACFDGIEALRQYRSDWQDQKGVLQLKPLHDWTSHGADAMRYLAVTGTDMLSAWAEELDYSNIDRGRVG